MSGGGGAALQFSFDGRPLRAAAGSTVAGALLSAGIRSWRTTRVLGQPRGVLCGIGTCFDCLVDVGDRRALRACVTALHDGDEVRTSASVGGGRPGRPGSAAGGNDP
jgi:predicted molibdopterin-dependent oxidoreductase YjgC